VLIEEGGGSCECGVALVEHRRERLEAVRHARCHVECDGDVVDRGAAGQPDRVVEQDLVRSGLDKGSAIRRGGRRRSG
jgi:Fe-S cluster assembly ATPase SufC